MKSRNRRPKMMNRMATGPLYSVVRYKNERIDTPEARMYGIRWIPVQYDREYMDEDVVTQEFRDDFLVIKKEAEIRNEYYTRRKNPRIEMEMWIIHPERGACRMLKDLNKLLRDELIFIAETARIPEYYNMKNAELRQIIQEYVIFES